MDDYLDSSSSLCSDDFEDMLMLVFGCTLAEILDEINERMPALRGVETVDDLLNGETCYELFRMDKYAFLRLCAALKRNGHLKDTDEIMVEEAVAMFLLIVGHDLGMRHVNDYFEHSIETIDRCFSSTLRAICRLGVQIISPTNSPLPPCVVDNSKYYPWFQKCVGAIDVVDISGQISSRGRNTVLSQKLLFACNFDMMFTFVYVDWSGTADDSKVFLDAVTTPKNNFPLPKEDKYYLIGSEYPCIKGFLSPYGGERYNLKEFGGSGRQPSDRKELFNYRHSSLRNVTECCYGAMEERFPVLQKILPHKLGHQPLIVVACCTIHNFVRQWAHKDTIFKQWEEKFEADNGAVATRKSSHAADLSGEAAAAMAAHRDLVSQQLWIDHVNCS